MAAVHGSLPTFNMEKESWSSYTERMDFYFEAHEIDSPEKKRSLLLSACGTEAYETLKNLVRPASLKDKSYTDLVAAMDAHLNPKSSKLKYRYELFTARRKPGESINAFVTRLQSLSQHCAYKDEIVAEMLRDAFVFGVNDVQIQRQLFREKDDFTLQSAIDTATVIDLSAKDASALHVNNKAAQPILNVTPDKSHSNKSVKDVSCYRCGGPHLATQCRFRDAVCRACGKKGHLAKVCRSSKPRTKPPSKRPEKKPAPTHMIQDSPQPPSVSECSPSQDNAYTLFTVRSHTKPITVPVKINDKQTWMELDTGASLSIIGESTYRSLFGESHQLDQSDIVLKMYDGQELPVLGSVTTRVEYEGQQKSLPLIVVQGGGASLFGRDWLEHFKLDWSAIHAVQQKSDLDMLLQRYSSLFREEVGTLKGYKAKIVTKSDARPRFYKPRRLPYAIKAKVEQELDRLQAAGVISPVTFSDWAAPIVPVTKANGQIRICGDYKMTVNQVANSDVYPLPLVEDLFNKLSGGKLFTKLDLTHAYQQVLLDDESKKLTTINMTKGLFQYERLPFGVAAAPSIFQRLMESLLQDLPRVAVYIDDIVVAGTSVDDHLANLDKVMARLLSVGLTVRKSKCVFAASSIEYLGHVIDAEGLHPSKEKVRAIKDAPEPQSVSQLKSFLGLLNYYSKFLPNLSVTLYPLYRLLHKDVTFQWTDECREAFQNAKELLQSSSLLVHFDKSKELILSCDASSYGIGAVLGHKLDDGSEKPIAYVSRTLSAAEKNYSQLEKEGLAIVFGVRKFDQYLRGHHFIIYSDHQPLKYLFNEDRPVPPMASSRIQRWALTLGAYQYSICHRSGSSMANADALSRLPLSDTESFVPVPGDVHLLFDVLSTSIVTASHIKEWTDKDPVLSRVRRFVLSGWSNVSFDPQLQPFYNRREELSVVDGVILWGARVIIPAAGRDIILEQLHDTHPGISRMKALARSYVWWPGLDSDITTKVHHCRICQEDRPNPPKAPLHPWDWPTRPWARLHIDHAGPFMGKLYLIVVDAYSRWIDVSIVSSTSADTTIQRLRNLFAVHGVPEQIVSDNGAGFTSNEFSKFTRANGIKHILTSPYHPASNGLAERAVQSFKHGVSKLSGSMENRILHFLFKYRITPQTTTGLSPSELLMGRRLRSHLDLLHPDFSRKALKSQDKSSEANSPPRKFSVDDKLYARNYQGNKKWIPVRVVKVTGPLTYKVVTESGVVLRRHIDQLRICLSEDQSHLDHAASSPLLDDWFPVTSSMSDSQPSTSTSARSTTPPNPPVPDIPPAPDISPAPAPIRRSTRDRRPVNRYTPVTS